jgi:hypothetical protein
VTRTSPCNSGRDGEHDAPDDPLAEPIKVAGFWRNRRRQEEIRVTLSRYEGLPIIDVRVFFTTSTGHMQASKKGIALAVAKLPELRKALEKAEAKAIDLELIEAVT